jgi:Transposase domain (DUF772)
MAAPSNRMLKLHIGRAPGAERSSIAAHAIDGRCRVAGVEPALRCALRSERTPSIAPEKLLRALLLQVLYTVRSERQLIVNAELNCHFPADYRCPSFNELFDFSRPA